MIATDQVIYSKVIDTIFIPLNSETTIELHNIALVLKCNSNLIFPGQF